MQSNIGKHQILWVHFCGELLIRMHTLVMRQVKRDAHELKEVMW